MKNKKLLLILETVPPIKIVIRAKIQRNKSITYQVIHNLTNKKVVYLCHFPKLRKLLIKDLKNLQYKTVFNHQFPRNWKNPEEFADWTISEIHVSCKIFLSINIILGIRHYNVFLICHNSMIFLWTNQETVIVQKCNTRIEESQKHMRISFKKFVKKIIHYKNKYKDLQN